ncbi:RNA polymerase sigma-70 factor [Flavobacteriaceae bacterium F08102]|nr:RNA polymerase sigma-70 factor [Flavobacteriaceae bacterium F08102]
MIQDKPQHISLALYKELFNTLYPPLCLFANRYLKDFDASKDIVQEVFIRFWTLKVKVQVPAVLKGYLYTAVKNKCLDQLKSARVKNTVSYDPRKIEQLDHADYFLAEIVTVETYTLLDKAIRSLPTKCEAIIRLSLCEYSTKDIAEELCIAPSTVRTQRQIAYEKLRKTLGNVKF